ncbi:MAG TPA: ABC transporter permease [Bryobacteraceae bacterium]|jgi:putative ABC transport system permease protein|nr:ABC transporter permease [Bryobacteraceae bacterium]
MLQDIPKDVRYGIRTLLRNRGFTAVALITLALGIGATAAMFSVVDAVLLRPLPYRDPGRLVLFFEDLSKLGDPRTRVSPPDYLDLKARKQLFEDVAAVNETSFNLGGNTGGAKQLNGALVTYNLFSVLGVQPLRGRTFLSSEDRPGESHVVLLSFQLWQNRFAGDPGIIGQSLQLNGEPYTVAGIMPAGFSFPDKEMNPIDVWTPRAFTSRDLAARRGRYLLVVGRLRQGVSLGQVNAGLRVLASQITRQYPNDMRDVSRFFAEPLQESNTHEVKRALLILLFAVGFILLIACANVANLLLSRAAGRRREIALRAALGAGRARILVQLLTESSLLAAMGGVLGGCLAVISFAFLKHLIPADLSHFAPLRFSLPVFAFTISICLASSLLFGLAPALQISKANLNEALREGGRGAVGSRHLLGSAFVAAEIGLSLMLLIGAGLLLKSFSKLRHVDPGFQPAHVLTLDFDMGEPKYRDWHIRTRFLEQVLEGVRAIPGVKNAGFAGDLPFTSKGWTEEMTPEGASARRDVPANVVYVVITPGYLEALRVPLIQGRFFNSSDREDTALVAIINRKAAQDFWPNQDPIGKRLKFGRFDTGNPWIQVVGVTADVKHAGLDEPSRDEVYNPYLQAKTSLQWQRFLVVRTSGDPMGILKDLRQISATADRDEPLNHVMTMSDLVGRETSQIQTQTALLSGLAVLALIMASVGIYGVMAYLVTQRTQEIGVRMALGAQKRQVLGMVLKRGMTLTLFGAIAGISAAFAVARLMTSLLFGISPTDTSVMAGGAILLIFVALVACLVPAFRAASIDPIEALRGE